MFRNFLISIGSNKVEFYTACAKWKSDEQFGPKIERIFKCITSAENKKQFTQGMLFFKNKLRMKLMNADNYPYQHVCQIGQNIYKVTD